MNYPAPICPTCRVLPFKCQLVTRDDKYDDSRENENVDLGAAMATLETPRWTRKGDYITSWCHKMQDHNKLQLMF